MNFEKKKKKKGNNHGNKSTKYINTWQITLQIISSNPVDAFFHIQWVSDYRARSGL